MALRDLQTNLKDLRFGKDTPGGGDSGLPYIKTSLPDQSSPIERIALESARFSTDFPIRGGLYAVRAVAEDAIRIRKFLTDFPKGSNFTAKQVGLQKSNPLIETGENGGRINTRTYNLNSNLLLSVLTAGSGIHYPRAGATPLTLLDDDVKYASIVGKKPLDDNRLFNLYKSKILGDNSNTTKLSKLGIAVDEFQIMNYIGGPDSLYGDGETILFKSTDHTGKPINTSNPFIEPISRYIGLPTTGSLSLFGATNYLKPIIPEEELGLNENNIKQNSTSIQKLGEGYLKREKYIIGTPVTDFRKDISPSGSVFSRDYTSPTINIDRRVGIGSPGARPRDLRTNTNQIFEPGQDKVNLTPIYYGAFNKNVEEDPNTRDLIKFAFETIDNNNPNNTYRAHFRAFLKGFTDNNSADWDAKRYTGRGDNMYTYQGFDRNISDRKSVV
jgi:hypothetical protein